MLCPNAISRNTIAIMNFVLIVFSFLLRDIIVNVIVKMKYTADETLGYIILFRSIKNKSMFSVQLHTIMEVINRF
jgi:hypothetical protein